MYACDQLVHAYAHVCYRLINWWLRSTHTYLAYIPHTHTRTPTCIHAHTSAYIHAMHAYNAYNPHMHIRTCMYVIRTIHACICAHVCMRFVHVYVHVYLSVYLFDDLDLPTHTHTHTLNLISAYSNTNTHTQSIINSITQSIIHAYTQSHTPSFFLPLYITSICVYVMPMYIYR
jgi:hypothetical protein